jgi:SNF2 family DNA or RNA helicase
VTAPAAECPQKLQKKDAFIQFVKANPNAKILMFSGYDASFSSVETKMQESNISFATVKGSNVRITKLLNEFKTGKYNVLFLNARNMGAGLNIESASHVVLFHHMNNELESQIIGRAMRLGRKEPLTVVHLLHENEQQRGDVISHV